MKKHLGGSVVRMILCFLIIFPSCMKMQNESDGDWIKVGLDIQRSWNTGIDDKKPVINDDGYYTYPTILITAVKGTMSAVNSATDLSDNYGRMLLQSDNTVRLTLPVGDSVRLVRAHYANDPTLQEILEGSLTPQSIGISEPFSIDANTTRKSVQIVMPSITYNMKKGDYIKGIYKTSATGTKSFDPNYWGQWDSGVVSDNDYGSNWLTETNSLFFLENDNKTISFIKAIQYPFPFNWIDNYELGNRAFADGTFPGKRGGTGGPAPKRSTSGTYRITFDMNGNVAYNNWDWGRQIYQKLSFEYDDTTGHPTGGRSILWDASTDTRITDVNNPYGAYYSCPNDNRGTVLEYSFYSLNNFHFRDYGYGGYTIKDNSGDTQCIYEESRAGYNYFAGEVNETRTIAWYDADGTTLISNPNWSIQGEANAAKWIRTRVLDGNVHTETKKWYDASGDETYRTVITDTINNVPLRHRSASSSKGYSVSSGVATLVYQDDYTYTNNFETGHTEYTVTEGVAAVNLIHTATVDSQGRYTSWLTKDVNGNSTYQIDYTFDTNGRRNSIREFSFVNGVKTPICYNGYNFDYAYSSDTSGNKVITWEGYCNLSDGSPGTYQDTPWLKLVRTYNSLGMKTGENKYYDASTLTGQLLRFNDIGTPATMNMNSQRSPKINKEDVIDIVSGSKTDNSGPDSIFSVQTEKAGSTLKIPPVNYEQDPPRLATSAATWVLYYRQNREYDASGALTRENNYDVSDDVASLRDYWINEYDENLFVKAMKWYDEDGDLNVCADEDGWEACKCKNFPSGHMCYQGTIQVYK